jgi:hypothetical protein
MGRFGTCPTVLAASRNALGYGRGLSSHSKQIGRMTMRWRADSAPIEACSTYARESRLLRERVRLARQRPIHLTGCQVLALDIRRVCADRLKDVKTKQHWRLLKQDYPTGHSQLRPAIVIAGTRRPSCSLVTACDSFPRYNRVRRQKDWHIYCKLHFPLKLAQCL